MIPIPVVDKIFDLGKMVLGRVIKDPAALAAAELELAKLHQTGELAQLAASKELALGQIEVNKIEAASESLFKSGWRPAVGWVGVAGLAYQMLLSPLLGWGSLNFGWIVPPNIDTTDLMTLLMGILGLGAFRSFDKKGAK